MRAIMLGIALFAISFGGSANFAAAAVVQRELAPVVITAQTDGTPEPALMAAMRKRPARRHTKVRPRNESVGINVHGLAGADISDYQDKVDWKKLSMERKFVIIRVSHGLYHDVRFTENWTAAHETGVIRGAYHYFDPREALRPQIRYFIQTVKQLETGDLPPILDIEEPKIWRGVKQEQRVPLVLKWLKAVEAGLGVKPAVYMSSSFVEDVLGLKYADALKGYQIWVAQYNVRQPVVPLPFDKFLFWQWSEKGKCDGVVGKCDQDVFPGSDEDLKRYTIQQQPKGNPDAADQVEDESHPILPPVHSKGRSRHAPKHQTHKRHR